MGRDVQDWDAAAENAITHFKSGKRVFTPASMLALIDGLCAGGQVHRDDILRSGRTADEIMTIVGHVTTAVHGKGSVPPGGWYRKEGPVYVVNPAFSEAWRQRRPFK